METEGDGALSQSPLQKRKKKKKKKKDDASH